MEAMRPVLARRRVRELERRKAWQRLRATLREIVMNPWIWLIALAIVLDAIRPNAVAPTLKPAGGRGAADAFDVMAAAGPAAARDMTIAVRAMPRDRAKELR